jgi:nicotinamide-nucleotide amidase
VSSTATEQHGSTTPSPQRRLLRAVLLAVGSELTNGETRDTNSGDLAQALAREGVEVAWITALPDREPVVVKALSDALAAADLVVTTGGLGPTPDDLTREAIAAACGEQPSVDPELECWLRHLFERRRLPFPTTNLKQAWLVPSATAIPNERGTAPGWWVERPDGRVIVAMPGPPREMTAMWHGWVLPRLRERGLGEVRVTQTFRLTGIGESHVAALLGEALLRRENPVVATYARSDAVDVRVSARSEGGRSAQALVDDAAAAVTAALGDHVWGHDDDTWPGVLGRLLAERAWTVAVAERGTEGSLVELLGDATWLLAGRAGVTAQHDADVAPLADAVRTETGAAIGLAVTAREAAGDTVVAIAAAGPWGTLETSQTAFLGGTEGRRRAAIAASAFLYRILTGQQGPVPLADNRGRRSGTAR